jgi:NADH-quinone oxidoreductase subunit A
MLILGIKFIDVVIQQYFCCFFFLLFCVFLACLLVFITYLVSPQKKDFEKLSVYECGFEPFGDSRNTFDAHFYIVGVLFIIFDLEIVYLLP